MEYYKRKLPHWQISGAEYFVTFRLAGSLPIPVVKELKQLRRQHQNQIAVNQNIKETLHVKLESKLFKKYEELLDSCNTGPNWLSNSKIADIIKESIHYRDRQEYDLYAYCIMSNHVHMVFRHTVSSRKKSSDGTLPPITRIQKNLKSYSSSSK